MNLHASNFVFLWPSLITCLGKWNFWNQYLVRLIVGPHWQFCENVLTNFNLNWQCCENQNFPLAYIYSNQFTKLRDLSLGLNVIRVGETIISMYISVNPSLVLIIFPQKVQFLCKKDLPFASKTLKNNFTSVMAASLWHIEMARKTLSDVKKKVKF